MKLSHLSLPIVLLAVWGERSLCPIAFEGIKYFLFAKHLLDLIRESDDKAIKKKPWNSTRFVS